MRRRGKTGEPVEYYSIVKALQAIEAANVAILLLDASTGITEQDAHVAGYVLERGRAVVIAVNKWDAADKSMRERMKMELAWKLGFLGFAETHFVSAKDAKGLGPLMRSVDAAHAAAMARLSTPKLTRAMIAAVERQAPPKTGLIRPGCATRTRAASTRRASSSTATRSTACRSRTSATSRVFRNQFALTGTPMRIEFRTGRNPYAHKREGLIVDNVHTAPEDVDNDNKKRRSRRRAAH